MNLDYTRLILVCLVCSVMPLSADNPIVSENRLPGTSNWDIVKNGAGFIDGFVSQITTTAGSSLDVYVNIKSAPEFQIDIYRLGWYGGLGARQVLSSGALSAIVQPACEVEPVNRTVDCSNWASSYSIIVPATWVTGVYWVKFTEITSGNPGRSTATAFVLRDDSSTAPHFVEIPFSTYQAYNGWGSYSLYHGPNNNYQTRSYKVSFDRPFENGKPLFYTLTYPMIRWLEHQGIEVTYGSSIDLHVSPDILQNRRSFVSIGHDEYWSYEMRQTVETAISHGINAAVFGGNTMFRQIRWEDSRLGNSRVMTCYMDANLDPFNVGSGTTSPVDPSRTTTAWRNPPLNRPENAVLGAMYGDGFHTPPAKPGDFLATNTSQWIYQGTGMKDGDTILGVIGYEFDAVFHNGFEPPNVIALSRSPICTDNLGCGVIGNTTIYQSAAGGWVFNASSMEWPNGLDHFAAYCGQDCPALDQRFERITRNLIDRFEGRSAISADAVMPKFGSGLRQTFTASYSDPASALNLKALYFLIGSSPSAGVKCQVVYLSKEDALYLVDDAALGLLGPIKPGGPGSVQNSQCILDGLGSSTSATSLDIKLKLSLTFSPTFTGVKNIFTQASDLGSGSTNWQNRGEWTVTAEAQPVSVSPSSGRGATNIFSAIFNTPAGEDSIVSASLRVGGDSEGSNACSVTYESRSGALALANDENSAPAGRIVPGGAADHPSFVQNSACLLASAGSSVTRKGTLLTVNAALAFTPAFAGTRIVTLQASDGASTTNWVSLGTWDVTSSATPIAFSVSPSSGSASSVEFDALYLNPAGASSIKRVYTLTNSSNVSKESCYLYYDPVARHFFLLNDDASTWMGPLSAGSSQVLSNAQCSLDGSRSGSVAAGIALDVKTALTFKPTFKGIRNIYIQVVDSDNVSSGWNARATWTVP